MAFEGLDMPESPAALPSDDEGMSIANLMGVQARTTGPSTTKWDKIYSQCVCQAKGSLCKGLFFWIAKLIPT